MHRFAQNIAQTVWQLGSARTRWGSLQSPLPRSPSWIKEEWMDGRERVAKGSEKEGKEEVRGKEDAIPSFQILWLHS